MSKNEYWGPIPHWNNFTLAELKEIREHCRALEHLGIAQDEKMLYSIERDIKLRDRAIGKFEVFDESHAVRIGKRKVQGYDNAIAKQPQENALEQTA